MESKSAEIFEIGCIYQKLWPKAFFAKPNQTKPPKTKPKNEKIIISYHMDQLLFTEVCLEMAYLYFLGGGSLASLLPPCCLHSVPFPAGHSELLKGQHVEQYGGQLVRWLTNLKICECHDWKYTYIHRLAMMKYGSDHFFPLLYGLEFIYIIYLKYAILRI